ncbi:Oligoribonuclease, mitochondrial [Armadillidium vulgare]|nr:Oligoribonuclease, mitochondrial [Armadillidium vulgare]
MASVHSNSMNDEYRLVWIDLKMTGLDTRKDHFMEISIIVTDSNLDVVGKGPNLIIKVEDKVLNDMNKWCQQHHGISRLMEEMQTSDITLSMAEDKILEFLVQHTKQGKAPLAGNSVHANKKFIDKYMPKVMKHLHYRIVDVSTLNELCRRWYETEFKNIPRKKLCYRAFDDIKESINELKYYRSSIFKKLESCKTEKPARTIFTPIVTKVDERLVWIDLEMTGLNEEKEKIMEVAVIVTDSYLDIIEKGPSLVIKVEDEVLNNMNDWCQKHHGESGLTEACRRSDITLSMAEDKILEFLVQHVEKGIGIHQYLIKFPGDHYVIGTLIS